MSSQIQALEKLAQEVSSCQKCKLSQSRTQTVFGEGDANAELMFIGEGPGKQEDIQGRPFIGRSGNLLTRMIELGSKIPRSKVYICNLVKCRPTVDLAFEKDRAPDENELEACTPYLIKQIQVIKPKVIVTLGGPATKFLLQNKEGITKIHGKWYEFQGIPLMPIYHPSYILRNGGEKSPLRKVWWEAMKKVIQKLETS